MSFQEIKDEYKESEGQPEVKRKIREKQREAAMASMIDAIKDADVVVTNPNHFAVALSYQVGGTAAPVVIAKVSYPIPYRTRKSSPLAPMVLCLKAWKSRTLPALKFCYENKKFAKINQNTRSEY